MLKFIYDNASEVPPALASYFLAGADGKMTLQVEGAIPKAQLDQFRQKGIDDLKAKDLELARFNGIDPVKYQDLLSKETELATGKLVNSDKLDEAVALRLAPITAAHEKALKDATEKLNATTAEVSKLKINGALADLGAKNGVKPEAMPDFIARGERIFRLDENGNVIAVADDGKSPRYANDGFTPLTVEAYVKGAATDKAFSHLFNPSTGSGAPGSGTPGGGTGVNPWAAATRNLTEQGKILNANPAEARRLAGAAGITLPAGV